MCGGVSVVEGSPRAVKAWDPSPGPGHARVSMGWEGGELITRCLWLSLLLRGHYHFYCFPAEGFVTVRPERKGGKGKNRNFWMLTPCSSLGLQQFVFKTVELLCGAFALIPVLPFPLPCAGHPFFWGGFPSGHILSLCAETGVP